MLPIGTGTGAATRGSTRGSKLSRSLIFLEESRISAGYKTDDQCNIHVPR